MSSLRPLTILVASSDPARFQAALSLAAASAARGRPTCIFLQAEAVALLHPPLTAPQDPRYAAAGMPTLAELVEEAQAIGVTILACQSGLPLAGMTATELPKGINTSGLVALLSDGAELVAF